MLLIHGTYHWRARRTAFRNDWCRNCASPRLAVRVRTVDVLHLFWIPLLPIGIWSRWFCTRCGLRPHVAQRTRRGFKIAGAVAVGLMSLASWAAPVREAEDDVWLLWVMRLGLPLAAVALAVSAARQGREPGLRQRLATVPPFSGYACPLCGGQLVNSPGSRCSQCGAEHRPLPPPGPR